MYLQRKNQYCIFILSVLFCSETETLYFCRKKSRAKFRQKIKTTFLGHESFLLFNLKLQYFVQESSAKFTIFYLL